ncbi:hypothetical protein FHS21_005671 [Phyllobacterium trifolii]|uniref:Antitoxin n=1 Tax=Phyllobacterium trifolii TaxID=300193 RepID=A0A839UL33_9HYPH|nr:hypothetical protein [Phyllobacterium trifolii]MBB3149219.1 hypothetical protein [Phyllobacterium trifolii]
MIERIPVVQKVWSIDEAKDAFDELLSAADTEGEQIIAEPDRRYVLVAVKYEKKTSAKDFLRKGGPLTEGEEWTD